MNIINWPTYVNQRILEDTSITIGEGGYIEDASSSSYKERRLTALAAPDKFGVYMDFDWSTLDSDGLSEYDKFVRWYKFYHKRGTNPFWFPCITKHPVTNLLTTDNAKRCLYKITSALTPQPSGLSMRISMTWEEVYSGIINVPTITSSTIDKIEATKKYIDAYCVPVLPTELPEIDSITIFFKETGTDNWSSANPDSVEFKGNALRLYFNFNPGTYDIYVNDFNTLNTFTFD